MTSPERSRTADLARRARTVLEQHHGFAAVNAIDHDDGSYPRFARSAAGSCFTDVEGRSYIDWFLGGGPVALGHKHEVVQAAVREQVELGTHLSIPAELEVLVAEQLCALVPSAELVTFAKNGTDATSGAVRLARAITGREEIATCGYHGFQDWSLAARPEVRGIPAVLGDLVHTYPYDDLNVLEDLVQRRGDRLAAIFIEPVQGEMPAPEFFAGLRELADRCGALLVFDEVVTGFRMARGGVQELCGVVPDLTSLAKAMGNGFPISALVGRRERMAHMRRIPFGLTYRRDALSLAATRACLQVHATEDVTAHFRRIGARMQAGFDELAASHGLDWRLIGPPALPQLQAGPVGDLPASGAKVVFLESSRRNGVFCDGRRVWASYAHSDADVDRTLAAFDQAMGDVIAAARGGAGRVMDSAPMRELVGAPPKVVEGPLGDGPAPCPFGSGNVAFRGDAGGNEVEAGVVDGAVRLAVHGRPGAGNATIAAQWSQKLSSPRSLRVAYALPEWEPRNAVVDVIVAVNGQGGFHRGVRHAASTAEYSWTMPTTKGVRVPCPVDVREAVLELQCNGRGWSAAHEYDGRREVLRLAAADDPGEVSLTVRVRVTGRVDRIAVEVRGVVLGAAD